MTGHSLCGTTKFSLGKKTLDVGPMLTNGLFQLLCGHVLKSFLISMHRQMVHGCSASRMG